MEESFLWSDFRLKNLSIESKNMQIGVWTRKIRSYKVKGLKMCMSSRCHAMAPILGYSVRDPCNWAKLAHNSVPESIMEQLQSMQLRQTYAIAWTGRYEALILPILGSNWRRGDEGYKRSFEIWKEEGPETER